MEEEGKGSPPRRRVPQSDGQTDGLTNGHIAILHILTVTQVTGKVFLMSFCLLKNKQKKAGGHTLNNAAHRM